MSSDVHDVSMILGELRGAAEEIRRTLSAMREDHANMDQKIDGLQADVATLKNDMNEVKPRVQAANDFRLKALGVLAALSMFSGWLGSYMPAALKKIFA